MNLHRDELFSKGVERRNLWLDILRGELPLDLVLKPLVVRNILVERINHMKHDDLNTFYFVIAGLMIIFQVFSDGNHRTASQFYYMLTNRHITEKQYNAIKTIYQSSGDFLRYCNNPKYIMMLIEQLASVSHSGGSKIKKTKRKTKRIRKSKRTYRRKK